MKWMSEQRDAQAAIREESWTVRGGAQVTLRAARATDHGRLRTFVDGLSRESRYFRFLTGGPVANETLARSVSRQNRDVALVVTFGEVIVANAEYVVNDEGLAELAVVVADNWQGQGLGRRLIQRLQQLARAASLRGMRGDVLSENRRMLAIMRDCGFATRRNPEDSMLHEVSLTLAEPRKAPALAALSALSAPSAPSAEWLPRDWFAAN